MLEVRERKGMEMDIEGDDGTYTSVKSLPLNKEKKFLGVHDSPEGGNIDELEAKRKKDGDLCSENE